MKTISISSPRFERVLHPVAGLGDGNNGTGRFKLSSGRQANVIFSNGGGWEHVSMSTAKTCPTWEEMCELKDFFFEPHEWVVQFHPAASDYVNCHPRTLHLWRSLLQAQPTPPIWMVGPRGS